jgi:hypothetical protein
MNGRLAMLRKMVYGKLGPGDGLRFGCAAVRKNQAAEYHLSRAGGAAAGIMGSQGFRRVSTIRSRCDAITICSCASRKSVRLTVRWECGFLYEPIAPANRC